MQVHYDLFKNTQVVVSTKNMKNCPDLHLVFFSLYFFLFWLCVAALQPSPKLRVLSLQLPIMVLKFDRVQLEDLHLGYFMQLNILGNFFISMSGSTAEIVRIATMQPLHILALNKHSRLLDGIWTPPEWAFQKTQMGASRFIVICPWKSGSIISAVFYWPNIRSQGQPR